MNFDNELLGRLVASEVAKQRERTMKTISFVLGILGLSVTGIVVWLFSVPASVRVDAIKEAREAAVQAIKNDETILELRTSYAESTQNLRESVNDEIIKSATALATTSQLQSRQAQLSQDQDELIAAVNALKSSDTTRVAKLIEVLEKNPKTEDLLKKITLLETKSRLPIGTILPSVAPPQKFLAIHGVNWALANGSDVNFDTEYYKMFETVELPNLSNAFLRGATQESNSLTKVEGTLQNTQWKDGGMYVRPTKQADWVHHPIPTLMPTVADSTALESLPSVIPVPEHVTVYFYIKIN